MNCAIASIITSDYIAEAACCYSYIKESNPGVPYIVMLIGEAADFVHDLPEGPRWIWWEELYCKEARLALAQEYTPFELSCLTRGRLHGYMNSNTDFDKWVLVDTDIGILSSLRPLWDALDNAAIVLTAHTRKPVESDKAAEQEGNILRCGIYNGGVVAMRKSQTASEASAWLMDRLERYGHAFAHREGSGLPNHYPFEFVDQIWLNLIPCYFKGETSIIDNENFNLGHWNLHQGTLSLRDGIAYFNDERVLVAHFSGLPSTQELETVSAFSKLYLENPSDAWKTLALDYLDRLSKARSVVVKTDYHYKLFQPKKLERTYRASTKQFARLFVKILSKPVKILARLYKRLCRYTTIATHLIVRVLYAIPLSINMSFKRTDPKKRRDISQCAFTNLNPRIDNYETYVVRSSILSAVNESKHLFHGKLIDVGAGSSPYKEIIMDVKRVSDYIRLDFPKSEYHIANDLELTWDGKHIPADANSFDTVIMTEVLEHVQRPADLLAELCRILKPGGLLFLTVPWLWPMHELPNDHHRFTPVALSSYLEESGFEVLKMRLLGGWDHSLAQMLGLWLTNRSMGARRRKLVKLLAWPIYLHLLRSGHNEFVDVRNHQMIVGIATVARLSKPSQ